MDLSQIINREIWNLDENVQKMDKEFVKTNLFDENDRVRVLNITGGDNYTYLMAKIYAWIFQIGDFRRDRDYGDQEKEAEYEKYYRVFLENIYEQAKNYNQNFFPIKNFNPFDGGGLHPIDVAGAFKGRKKALEFFSNIPKVLLRNLREEFRKIRDVGEMEYLVPSTIDKLKSHFKLIDRLSDEKRDIVLKKVFSSKNDTFEKVLAHLDKTNINYLWHDDGVDDLRSKVEFEEDSGEAEMLYDNGNIMVVDVKSSDALKNLGCGAEWCFVTEHGTEQWHNYADNSHVNIVYNFNSDADDATRMVVVLPQGSVYNMYNQFMDGEENMDGNEGWYYLDSIGAADHVNANLAPEEIDDAYDPKEFTLAEDKSVEGIAKAMNADIIYDKKNKPFFVRELGGHKDYLGVFAYDRGRFNQIGGVNYHVKDGKVIPLGVSIDDKYQRRGIGTAFYKYIKDELGMKLNPSHNQTKAGKKLWQRVNEIGDYMANMYSNDDLEHVNDPNDKSDGGYSGFAVSPESDARGFNELGDRFEEGLKDNLITKQGMNLPIGKLFFGGLNEYEEYKNMSEKDMLRVIKYIENIDKYLRDVDGYLAKTELGVEKPKLDKNMNLLYRLYSINAQNIHQILDMVDDPPSYYNNLMKLQNTIKRIKGGLSEDLEYNHVDDATQDKFMIGGETINEDGTSSYTTSTGSRNAEDIAPWLQEEVIPYSEDDYDDEIDYDKEDVANQIYDIANKSDVNILRGKNISGFVMRDGVVAGAIFTEIDGDEYSFDVVVDPKYQGSGLGKELVEYGLNDFKGYKEMYDDSGTELKLKLDVVSPLMRNILKKYHSLRDLEQVGPDRYIMGEEESIVPYEQLDDIVKELGAECFAIISAFVTDKSNDYNSNATKLLYHKVLKSLNTKVIKMTGQWDANVLETAFFVLKPESMECNDFMGLMEETAKIFKQESYLWSDNGDIILKYIDGPDDDIGDDLNVTNSYVGFKFEGVDEDLLEMQLVNEEEERQLHEESVSRLLNHIQGGDFAIMSANRNELSNKENAQQSKALSSDLQREKAGHTNLVGHWEELHRDTGQEIPVRETSFFIPKPEALDFEKFREFITGLGEKYDQESVIVGNDGIAYELFANGGNRRLGKLTMQNIGKAYSSIRKKPNVDFTFEGFSKNEEPINESRRVFDAEDYKGISDKEIIDNRKLMMDFQLQQVRKEYFSEEDVDDVIHLYLSMKYNYERYRKLWGYETTSIALELLSKILKQRGILKEERIKSWMPKMTTPSIKKSCTLGGKADGTSDDCSQGDTGVVSYKPLKDGQSHKSNTANVAEDQEKWFEKGLTESELNEIGEANVEPYKLTVDTVQKDGMEFSFTTNEGTEYVIQANFHIIPKAYYLEDEGMSDADQGFMFNEMPRKILNMSISYTLREHHEKLRDARPATFKDNVRNRFGKGNQEDNYPTVNTGEPLKILSTVALATKAAYKKGNELHGAVNMISYIPKKDNAEDQRRAKINKMFIEKGLQKNGIPVKKTIRSGAQVMYIISTDEIRESVTQESDSTYINESMVNENNIPTLEGLPFKDKIESMGGKLYSVGGAVRDKFLGKSSKDLDIVITGIPEEELLETLKKFGTANLDGESFGVIKFKDKKMAERGEEPIDIALPRKEISTGAGHKNFEVVVDHNLDIEEDLKRRDFTINAIAEDSDGAIIDPFNGRQDLQDKVLRMTSKNSFIDDELRMLRGVQFASRFGFDIEPKTLRAIRKAAPTIKEVAKERWLMELEKIVEKGDPWTGLEWLKKTKLYEPMFGKDVGHNRSDFNNINTMGEFIFMMIKDTQENPAEFVLKNLIGGGSTNKDSSKSKAKLGKEISALSMAFKNVSDVPARNRIIASKMLKMWPEIVNSEVLPQPIDVAINELKSGKYPLSTKELAVNGNDLMNMGLVNREIGNAQDFLMNAVYYDKVPNEKDALLKAAHLTKLKPQVEQLSEGLNEEINAGTFNIYHRTEINPVDIASKGFSSGHGAMYGVGLYGTYDLGKQLGYYDTNMLMYGNYIVEFEVKNNNKFIILDKEEAKKVYGNKHDIITQLKKVMGGYFNTFYDDNKNEIDNIVKMWNGDVNYTSNIASKLWRLKGFIGHVDGMAFTGRRDGKVFLLYNTNLAKPIKYTYDNGKTWKNLQRKTSVTSDEDKIDNQMSKEIFDFDYNLTKKERENYLKYKHNEMIDKYGDINNISLDVINDMGDTERVLFYSIMLKTNIFEHIYPFFLAGGNLTTAILKNEKTIIINKKGQPSIDGITSKDLDNKGYDVKTPYNNTLALINKPQVEALQESESVRTTKAQFGCLMIYPEISNWGNIVAKIKPEDIYDVGDFGIEDEPHVTILYGFHDKVEAQDFLPFLSGISEPIEITINGLSHFENEEFDVVKLDCESLMLRELRKYVEQLPHTKTYPNYVPHMTLAYVKKGEGEKYNYKLQRPITIKGTKIVYSNPNKKKAQMEIAKPIEPEKELL